jgi:hypothetical protein
MRVTGQAMNHRTDERFNMEDFFRERSEEGESYIELSFDTGPVRAEIKDLSVRGVGLEIENPVAGLAELLNTLEDLFIKIVIGDRMFVANSQRAWSAVVKKGDREMLTAGLRITMIAPEDSIVLSKIIEGIRKG